MDKKPMGISFPIIMKARFYQRKDRDRWTVYLSWKGIKYFRYHYDGDIPLVHETMARQIAEAVNADILKKKKGFDPRQWFRVPGYELEFRTYSQKWLLRSQDRYAPSVLKDVRRYVAQAQAYFDRLDIREIRHGQIEDFMGILPAHYSPKTRRNVLTVLHKIFADAWKREDIPRIPGFPTIQVPEPEIKWLTREWQDRILEAIPEADRPIFIFLRTYGVRPGEARALQWDCVDFEKALLTIKRTYSGRQLRQVTKTKRIRYLPISPAVASLLRANRGLAGPVFRTKKGRAYPDHLPRIWNEAVKRVGGPEISLYQGTRHSLGCQLLNDGVPMDLIRKLFGHTKEDMTRRYAEISVESLKRVLE